MILISDGNDTNSRTDIADVRQVVRETEVLVYAVGIDGEGQPTIRVRHRGHRFRFLSRAADVRASDGPSYHSSPGDGHE